jgi:hypothetical protein
MEQLWVLLRRPLALKGAIWGVVLLASEPIIWLLDWAGRLELLKEHFGGAVTFLENPIAVVMTWLAGFLILASAVRSGLQQTPPATRPEPEPPASPAISETRALSTAHVPADDIKPLSGEEYLRYRDSELGSAVRNMAWDSAWGRWYSAQQLSSNGKRNDWVLMNTAASLVVDALIDGRLEARGRTPPGITYEPIPRETWRLAFLQTQPNDSSIWKVVVAPRSGVDPARLGTLLGYDSVVVDSRQFLRIWPTKNETADVARRLLLEHAKSKNVDPAEIERLSWER